VGANTIYIQVDANSGSADAAIKKLNEQIAAMGPAAEKASVKASMSTQGFTVAIGEAERAVFGLGEAIAALGVVRLGAEMFQSADKINKMQIALEGMLGSGAAATAMMQNMREVAAKSPFAFQDIGEAAQKLKAFGMEASKIPHAIEAISNTAAALGGTKERLESITLGIGQMYVKGLAQGKEFYRQLGSQGVDVNKILGAALQKENPAGK
jgi:tape measure domain-containing protein